MYNMRNQCGHSRQPGAKHMDARMRAVRRPNTTKEGLTAPLASRSPFRFPLLSPFLSRCLSPCLSLAISVKVFHCGICCAEARVIPQETLRDNSTKEKRQRQWQAFPPSPRASSCFYFSLPSLIFLSLLSVSLLHTRTHSCTYALASHIHSFALEESALCVLRHWCRRRTHLMLLAKPHTCLILLFLLFFFIFILH